MPQQQTTAFGRLLRQYRVERHVTQPELARLAGIGTDTISTLERGTRRNPQPDTVKRLAAALDLSPSDAAALKQAIAQERLAAHQAKPSTPAAQVIGNFIGALPTGPLVARDHERAQGVAALAAALSGQGRCVMLAGEPGVGKTRFAQDLWLTAREHGAIALTGRCYASHTAVAYTPFLELLPAAAALAPTALRKALAQRWPEVLRLLPHQPLLPPSISGPGADAQQRLFGQVTDFLQTLAQHAPLAIFIDDVLWSDTQSLALWQHLVRYTRASAIFLLGTYCHTDLHLRPDLRDALHELHHERLIDRIMLERLAAEGTAALAATLLDAQPSSEVCTELHARAEGNPLFVQEVLTALVARGVIVDGQWHADANEEIVVPESVKDLVRERVERLHPTTQEVLYSASVLGQIFPFADVLALSGRMETEVEAAMEEATAASVVRALDAERYAFHHVLFQQAMYTKIPAQRRRRWHREAGEIIVGQANGAPRAMEAVRHFTEGAAPERALPFALLAGQQAEYVYAHAEAERFLRLALDLARSLGANAQEDQALAQLGSVLSINGRYDEAIALYDVALAHQTDPALCLRLLALLGCAHLGRGSFPEGNTRMREGLAAIPPAIQAAHPHEVAELLITLARGCMLERQPQAALTAAQRACDLARSTDDVHLQAVAETRLGAIFFVQGQLDVAFRTTEAALPKFRHLDENGCIALANLGTIALYSVDLDRHQHFMLRALDAAERIGSPALISSCLGNLASHAYITGDWPRAHRYWQRALAISRSSYATGNTIYVSANLAYQCLIEGDQIAAEQHLAEAETIAAATQSHSLQSIIEQFLAERDILAGEMKRPRARMEAVCRDIGQGDEWVQFWLGLAYAESGEAALAEAIIANRQAHFANGIAFPFDVIRIRWLQGRLAEIYGVAQAASAAYEDALARSNAIPYPFETVRILWYYGQFAMRQSDLHLAKKCFLQALTLCCQLGESFYAPHLTAALTRLQTNPATLSFSF